MKKHLSIVLAGLIFLTAGFSLPAQDKMDADDFLKYLQANQASIPYTQIDKTVQGSTLTLKIFCPKTAQENLLQAIERSAQVNYTFEGLAADQVACSVNFKVAPAKTAPAAKIPCPGKTTVLTETLKPVPFVEFRDFSGPALPEVVAVKSPSAGMVSEVKVAAGSLVEEGQELLALNAGVNDEIKALEQEVLRKKKILTARQGWKVKSEKAIQSADRDYQKTISLLDEKKAQSAQVIRAPLAGTVQSLIAVAGVETTVDALLLEISASRQMLVQMSLMAAEGNLFSPGDKISGHASGKEEVSAEIVAVEAKQLVLRLDNSKILVKAGDMFTIRKLIGEHDAALVVPTKALAKDSLGDYVYVAEKNMAKKSYVVPGTSVDGKTMILKGLGPQAQLVISGFECLAAGKKIRIISQEQLAKEKADTDAKLQKKQAEADAKDAAKARKEKEKMDKQVAEKAAAEAKLLIKQAEAAAKAESKAIKEKEKLEKQAAKQSAKTPAAADKAEEVKKEAAVEAGKVECPKRAQVLVDPIKLGTFLEYRYHSTLLTPDVMPITNIEAGQVAAVKVSEGSLVEKGQELVLVFAGRNEAIVKLQQEAARKKKNLAARQNEKAPSEKAIQAAERDYLNTLSLLEQKTAQYALAILAPVAGTVRNLKVTAGDEITSTSFLLEIVTEEYLLANAPLNMVDSGGEQISGRVAGLDEEVTAQIIGLRASQLALRLDNTGRLIKAGSIFTMRKLKTEHANAIVIPAKALFNDSLGDYVYVAEKKKAKKIYVGVGAREADRILILQGLAAEMPLILSGFECLADSRKISMIFPEDLARGRAQAMGPEKPATFINRMNVGVHGSFFLMLGKNFKEVYKDLSGFGGELAVRFSNKMDIWLSGGLAMKKAAVSWSSEELSFRLIPLAGAFRFYLVNKGKLSAYVGAGPNVFLVNDKNPAGDIKSTLIGFNALAGGYYKLSRKFSLQLMAKFNMVKKDVVPDSDLDDPLDLTGMEFNFGVVFKL